MKTTLLSLSLLLIFRGAHGAECANRLELDLPTIASALSTTQADLLRLLPTGEEFSHHFSGTLRHWERDVRRNLGHGLVYRGMAVSAERLDAVLKLGLTVDQTGYAGIFYSTEPAEAMSYAYGRLKVPGLAVVLALTYDHPSIVGRATMTEQDIPPEAIAAVLIFDPRGDRSFPFRMYPRPTPTALR